jgi:hypothetical protein
MSDPVEVDPIELAIAAVEAQIEKLQNARETLLGLRGITAGAFAPANASRQPSAEATFGHDAFFGMTVGDATKKYLNARKRTAPTKVIADALVAGGWKTASKNVSENIRAILSRNDDFVKINGEFGLAEWYPGRKATTKPRPPAPGVIAEGNGRQVDLEAFLAGESPIVRSDS